MLEISPQLKKSDIVKTIFDFLFLLPSIEDQQAGAKSDQNPKCKRKVTRKKAFGLLLTLCQNHEANYIELLKELYKFHEQIQRCEGVVKFEEFDSEVGMRSASGYVGLKNFGCTCYMNALIQQLFMIQELRLGIL